MAGFNEPRPQGRIGHSRSTRRPPRWSGLARSPPLRLIRRSGRDPSRYERCAPSRPHCSPLSVCQVRGPVCVTDSAVDRDIGDKSRTQRFGVRRRRCRRSAAKSLAPGRSRTSVSALRPAQKGRADVHAPRDEMVQSSKRHGRLRPYWSWLDTQSSAMIALDRDVSPASTTAAQISANLLTLPARSSRASPGLSLSRQAGAAVGVGEHTGEDAALRVRPQDRRK
jgi:hypothetical protein